MATKHAYLCYCLKSLGKHKARTYCGITNDFARRIRQHNKVIKGGAKYTSRFGPWAPFIHVRNFPNKTIVLQFEWAMKHARKGSGIAGRVKSLEYLLQKPRFTSKAMRTALLDLTVCVTLSREQYLKYAKLTLDQFVARRVQAPNVRFRFQSPLL